MKYWQIDILAVLIALGVWQLFGLLGMLNPLILPSPLLIGQSLIKIIPTQSFASDVIITLLELAAAIVIIVSAGIALGFSIAMRDLPNSVLEPLIIAFFAIPSVVLYPLLFLVFGLGPLSKIAFGVLVGLFPVIQSTVAAVRQVRAEHLMVSRSYGSSSFQTFRKVIFPSAAPLMISGIKLGVALAFIGVVAGEMIASQAGIGFDVSNYFNTFRDPSMFAMIVVILILAVILHFGLDQLGKRYEVAHESSISVGAGDSS